MKRINTFIVAAAMVLSFTGCSNEVTGLSSLNKEQTKEIENVKVELTDLNNSYKATAQTRGLKKWLRWLIFGAADVAGALGGGVSGACTASSLAWTVTKSETMAEKPEQETATKTTSLTETRAQVIQLSDSADIKNGNLEGLDEGSMGYLHNKVISSAFIENEDICTKSNEEVMNIILDELKKQTGMDFSESQRKEVMAYTTKIINSFDSSKTVEEYFKELEAQTTDVKQKEALSICGMVLDGLQYVDDNDTTYAETATKIIQNSSIDPEMKKTLLDGVSVANASAKLWNTEVLDTKLQK